MRCALNREKHDISECVDKTTHSHMHMLVASQNKIVQTISKKTTQKHHNLSSRVNTHTHTCYKINFPPQSSIHTRIHVHVNRRTVIPSHTHTHTPESFRLFLSPDNLHYSKELLMPFVSLLLLQH